MSRCITAYGLRFVTVIILITIILLPRVLPFPSIFFTDDEMQIGRWTSQMTGALLNGDWRNTVNNAYPAVTLAWIEAAQVKLAPLASGQGLTAEQMVSDDGTDVFAALPRRRLALALFNTVAVLVTFWLLRRLYNDFIAVTATILMALDPFLLTQSRVFRTEGITTGLMLLGALTIILYAKEQRTGWLVASAVLSSFATLTKITSIFLLPFAGLTLLIWPLMMGQRPIAPLVKQATRDVVLWSLLTGLIFFVFWPALWVAPFETIKLVYTYLQLTSTNIEMIWGGKGSALFFWGQTLREDPGVSFYWWSLAYRITPVALVGLLLVVVGAFCPLLQRRSKFVKIKCSSIFSRPSVAVTVLLVAYVVFYFIAMSLGASKVDRYLLPIFPAFSILAAVGFQAFVDHLSAVVPVPGLKGAVWGTVLISSAWLALPQHPYYYTYWNPLLGGARQAVKILPAGGRQGINMMVEYVNALPEAQQLKITGPGLRDCPVIFTGTCLQPSQFLLADYIQSDIFSLQRGAYLANIHKIIPETELVHQYTKDGVDYAWLYKMPAGLHHTEQWLGTHGKLRGYGFLPPQVGAGDSLQVSIFWINGEDGWTLANSEFFIKLLDENGQVQQVAPAQPGVPANPELSAPGDMVVFNAFLPIPSDMLLGTYPVEIGLRLKDGGQETWKFSLKDTENTITVNRGALADFVEALPIQNHLEYEVGATGLTLLGYNDLTGETPPHFDLYWQANRPLIEDYILELALLDQTGKVVVSWRNTLSPPVHPATAWQAGEVVKITFPLASGYPLPPGHYQPVLSILSADTALIDSVDLIPLENFALDRLPVNMQHQLEDITFGEKLDLLGYDLKGAGNTSSGLFFVTLYWLNRHPLEAAEADVQVFNHRGEVIAQQTAPVPASTSASTWQSASQLEFTLNDLPDSMVIKVRSVNDETWYKVQEHEQGVVEQVTIDQVLNKIAPLD
ncbi:MAG: glycosyltransferase family 39 protein [Anaerolineae bacterium]|nr:glycosyltransferase family 39 protein [Anaerolineae bacterium]